MKSILSVFFLVIALAPRALQADEKLLPLRRAFKPLPIPTGEKLVYEIRLARFPIYATLGTLTFEYAGELTGAEALHTFAPLPPTFAPGSDERFFYLRASAVSKGMLVAIAGVNLQDRFEALVDARDFSARLGIKEIKEGKKQQRQTAVFDAARATVTLTIQDLADPQATPQEKSVARIDGSLGLLSAIYFVRLQKLKEGQLIRFPVNDDNGNYEFKLLVGKRENLGTDCGKVKTIRLEPKILGPGELISRPGTMNVWVTDDARHIPLRLMAKTSVGTVTAKLLNYRANCQLLDPPAEEAPEQSGRPEHAKQGN